MIARKRVLSACISGGAHRITARCEYAVSVPAELFFSVYALPRLWWSTSRQLLQPRGRTAPAPAVVASLRCAGVPLEDHTPRQAQSQDKICRKFWCSFCHDTHVKTQCCGSHPAAPLLTDTRWLTVGPGTCEDLVATFAWLG